MKGSGDSKLPKAEPGWVKNQALFAWYLYELLPASSQGMV